MAIDQIASGFFSGGNRNLFLPLTDSLLYHDPFLVLADYQAYVACQDRVGAVYQDKARWTEMSILNVARMDSSRQTARSGNTAKRSGR